MESVRAENLNLPTSHPESNSPTALAAVPAMPVTREEEEAFILNWYSMYFGMNVPKPMKAKT